MGNEVQLAILGITAGLTSALIWVVKKVFDFSERHAKVVENNTKMIEGFGGRLEEHERDTKPSRELGIQMMDLIKGIMNTLEAMTHQSQEMVYTQKEIINTQKEIIKLLKK